MIDGKVGNRHDDTRICSFFLMKSQNRHMQCNVDNNKTALNTEKPSATLDQ